MRPKRAPRKTRRIPLTEFTIQQSVMALCLNTLCNKSSTATQLLARSGTSHQQRATDLAVKLLQLNEEAIERRAACPHGGPKPQEHSNFKTLKQRS